VALSAGIGSWRIASLYKLPNAILIRGYPYPRIEDAHYARNVEIKTSAQGRAPSATVCQTFDEFIAKSTGREMLAAA